MKEGTVDLNEDPPTCPLCMEDLDDTDRGFFPCPCEYQVCLWCLNYIKESMDGKCPACRQPYEEAKYKFVKVAHFPEKRASKSSIKSSKTSVNTGSVADGVVKCSAVPSLIAGGGGLAHYRNLRVIQRNLAYVFGVPGSIANEEELRKLEFMGRYGTVSNLVVAKHVNLNSAVTFNCYVTYATEQEAIDTIRDIDGTHYDGRTMRASFGTTKYCSLFLKGLKCMKADCFYLHRIGSHDDSFTREEMVTSRSGFLTKGGCHSREAYVARDGHPPSKSLYRFQLAALLVESKPSVSFFGKSISPSQLLQYKSGIVSPPPKKTVSSIQQESPPVITTTSDTSTTPPPTVAVPEILSAESLPPDPKIREFHSLDNNLVESEVQRFAEDADQPVPLMTVKVASDKPSMLNDRKLMNFTYSTPAASAPFSPPEFPYGKNRGASAIVESKLPTFLEASSLVRNSEEITFDPSFRKGGLLGKRGDCGAESGSHANAYSDEVFFAGTNDALGEHEPCIKPTIGEGRWKSQNDTTVAAGVTTQKFENQARNVSDVDIWDGWNNRNSLRPNEHHLLQSSFIIGDHHNDNTGDNNIMGPMFNRTNLELYDSNRGCDNPLLDFSGLSHPEQSTSNSAISPQGPYITSNYRSQAASSWQPPPEPVRANRMFSPEWNPAQNSYRPPPPLNQFQPMNFTNKFDDDPFSQSNSQAPISHMSSRSPYLGNLNASASSVTRTGGRPPTLSSSMDNFPPLQPVDAYGCASSHPSNLRIPSRGPANSMRRPPGSEVSHLDPKFIELLQAKTGAWELDIQNVLDEKLRQLRMAGDFSSAMRMEVERESIVKVLLRKKLADTLSEYAKLQEQQQKHHQQQHLLQQQQQQHHHQQQQQPHHNHHHHHQPQHHQPQHHQQNYEPLHQQNGISYNDDMPYSSKPFYNYPDPYTMGYKDASRAPPTTSVSTPGFVSSWHPGIRETFSDGDSYPSSHFLGHSKPISQQSTQTAGEYGLQLLRSILPNANITVAPLRNSENFWDTERSPRGQFGDNHEQDQTFMGESVFAVDSHK